MKTQKSHDLLEILPKNISLIIFEYAFNVNLVSRGNKQVGKKESIPELDQIGSLRKKIEDEREFCKRMVSLNNLKRINKNWKNFFSSPLLWENIFLHLEKEIEDVKFPQLPETFSFLNFNKYMILRRNMMDEKIEELIYQDYPEEECEICFEPREWDVDLDN